MKFRDTSFLIIFMALFTSAVLAIADRVVLGYFLKYPTELPLKISHPANYSEHRNNIEFSYVFNTNSQGLRYRELPLEKNEKEFRFLVLGDSYVEGVGVDIKDRFTEILERRLSNGNREVTFVNCGLQGAGPRDYARIFQHIGLKYDPDRMVIVYFANDIGDTALLSDKALEIGEGWLYPWTVNPERKGIKVFIHRLFPRTYALMSKVYRAGREKRPKNLVRAARRVAAERKIRKERIDEWARSLPKDLLEAANRGEFSAAHLTRDLFNSHFWTQSLDINDEKAEAKWRTASGVLTRIVKIAQEHRIPVALVYAPSPLQYDERYGDLSRALGGVVRTEWLMEKAEVEKRIDAWALESNVPFLNLTPYLRQAFLEGKKVHYSLDGHWTKEGNELVAELIENWINKEKMLLKEK